LAKPECQEDPSEPEPEPIGPCIPIGPDGIPIGVDVSRPDANRKKPDNRPICQQTNDDLLENLPPDEPGVMVRVDISEYFFDLYWGIYKWKSFGQIWSNVVYSYEPKRLRSTAWFWTVTPVDIFMSQSDVYVNQRRCGTSYSYNVTSHAGNLNGAPFSESISQEVSYTEIKLSFTPGINKPTPPPPNQGGASTSTPIPHPAIMDNCCDDTKKILARIEKQIKDISKILDVEGFQKKRIEMPASWIYPTNNTSKVVIDDIPDLIAATARLLDRRVGHFPQIIRLKDADPSKEGDQSKAIVINSLADLTKAILEFDIAAERENSTVNKSLLQIVSAIMFEVGTTHQLSIVSERMLTAVCEYLDFEAIHKKKTFKMYFNPHQKLGINNLEAHLKELIKPHNQQIEVMEWKEGGESAKDKLNEIIKKVSLCAAALSTTKPFDQVKDEHKNMARLERLLIIKEMIDREGIPDLKAFFDDAEKGFPTSSEQSELIKKRPYGFDSGAPKFKQTTKNKKPKYTNRAKGK
jgi:hypothetical protein